MPSMPPTSDDPQELRRCLRDLVAVSTLPAVWENADPSSIGRSLAEVLLRILSADFVYVRLRGWGSGPPLEAVRTRQRAESEGRAREVGRAIEPWLRLDADAPPTIPSPVGEGVVRLAVLPIGHGQDNGLLAAGCGRPDFPSDAERLLLGVAVNQAAGLLQRKQAEEELRRQSERLRVTLASIGDAVITTDTEGRVTSLNSAAESLTGWAREEAEGLPLGRVFHIINELTREPAECPAAKALREGGIVGLANQTVLLARDGSERPIDDSAAPIKDGRGAVVGVVLVFRDVTERKRAEQHRSARLAVTHALSESRSVRDGAAGVLRAVCENLGWEVGFFWTVNEAGTALACANSWRRPGAPVDEFVAASHGRTFVKGEGLPGRVWASGKPAWILDVANADNFPRLAPAAHSGLHSAFGCPVVGGEQVLGVIEFFTGRFHQPDADLLEMMVTVAGSFGQLIERKAAEDEVRRSEQELADFFENATVGLHWVGPDGTILRANRAELDLLGYSREEYIGRPISAFHAEEEVICDILRRLKAGEKLTDYPARLRGKDGSIKDVLIDSSVMWRDGSFVHTRCFTRDVTERKRAEAKARDQEQRTRTILESISDAFCALDLDWRFTYANRQAEVLLGRTRDELIGRNHWEVYPETIGTDLDRHYRRAVSQNETARLEYFYPPHGRWYEVHAYPSAEGLSVYFRDVSERKRAEITLQESEQRFRQLADAMPQIVWTARPDGDIEYLNGRWTELSGLPQTAGNDAWGQLLHPDDATPAHQRWAASVRTGAPFEMELRLLDRRHGYRWHLIRTVAVLDGDGKVARWFGTSTDIHEQKRAEEASRFLAQASAELAAVVDYESTLQKVASLAVPYFSDWAAVDLADEDGTLRRLAVAHQDRDKVALVRDLMRDYPPDPRSPAGAYAVLRSGTPEFVGEITDEMLVRGARDERHLSLVRSLGLKSYLCVPLAVSGNTLGVLTFATAESGRLYTEADLALATDLANRAAAAVENTQLYQALREAGRRKDEFLATLAHELRNPLAPISNSLQILKLSRVDAATARQTAEMMERQVHHLVRLVDDLLDVSRVMRGKIELRRERVELATVVARAAETAQPLIEARAHRLDISLPDEPLPLHADPVRLAQVVGNLLTNAAKYTEPGGRIWLTGERDGGLAVLRVRDNGIGIAPDMLPRVFDLFVQVDQAAARSQGGLGIGLTLVKNLVEMHNGAVEARSDGLGRGCELIVRLPLSEEALARAHDGDPSPHAQAPSPSGHRLLVVDDNQDAADSLAMLLRLQGHEVRVAYSGMAALELTKDYSPGLVLLDIGMPGMDGYEAARRLRQQPGLQNVVLAALTGWGQQEDRRRSAEAGFDHHLVKPPEPQALEGVLAGLKRG